MGLNQSFRIVIWKSRFSYGLKEVILSMPLAQLLQRELFVGKVHTAWLTTIGPTAGLDPKVTSTVNTLLFGLVTVGTNLHHWTIIQEAKKEEPKL